MGHRGVSHLLYACSNKKTDCNYSIESTTMMTGEMKQLREDGSMVRL